MTTAAINHEILVWARQRAALGEAVLAKKLNVALDKLIAIIPINNLREITKGLITYVAFMFIGFGTHTPPLICKIPFHFRQTILLKPFRFLAHSLKPF
jgi:hypothetical protein